MESSLSSSDKARILNKLSVANKVFQKTYPGDTSARQPVHTVYGGADLFRYNTAQKMGQVALQTMKDYAPNFVEFAQAIELAGHQLLPFDEVSINNLEKELGNMSREDRKQHFAWLPYTVYHKVLDKLNREAVEDFRIDFEDGFGNRSWDEEDKIAIQAANECAKGMEANTLPPFIGIRIKPFTEDLKERGIRTLDIFLTTLSKNTRGQLPNNFVVMLPKVTITAQIETLVELFEIIESQTEIPTGALKMEMMVETTQSIIDADGKNPLRSFVMASNGRMISTAFGTYDYTASNNITAKHQDMGHSVCDFAHYFMKVALGGTGVWLSDGATNVMPIGPHKGVNLDKEKKQENRSVVHKSWKKAYGHTRYSLWKGLYQGWDLHPAQLPMRYAAIYSFFLESYEEAAKRLKAFVDKAARATLTDDVFDDAATGQGLLNFFLTGLNSGAISEEEALISGLSIDELRSRSFLNIMEKRKANLKE